MSKTKVKIEVAGKSLRKPKFTCARNYAGYYWEAEGFLGEWHVSNTRRQFQTEYDALSSAKAHGITIIEKDAPND